MAKAQNKTVATRASVAAFLGGIQDPARAKDCREVAAMMRAATGEKPRMWGPSIVGFGQYHYVYDSGREGDACIVGFSPRKGDLTIYIVPGFSAYGDLLARLGKHRTAKVCLYIKRLDDIDRAVLRELIERSVADMRARYPGRG
jgi:hypothetical protein